MVVPLTCITTTSIVTGSFPALYENAVIESLYKKGIRPNAFNYCLIVNTCETGKLFIVL